MTACGYTPAAVGEMEMHDVIALFEYWRAHPPVHEILAAAYGVKSRKEAKAAANPNDPSGIGGLIAMFPGGHVPADR